MCREGYSATIRRNPHVLCKNLESRVGIVPITPCLRDKNALFAARFKRTLQLPKPIQTYSVDAHFDSHWAEANLYPHLQRVWQCGIDSVPRTADA